MGTIGKGVHGCVRGLNFKAFSMTDGMARKGKTGGNREKADVAKQPFYALDTAQAKEDKE